jgi:hypothetical protein
MIGGFRKQEAFMPRRIPPLLCLGLVFTACSHFRTPAPLPPLEPIRPYVFDVMAPGKLVVQRHFLGRDRDVEYVIDVETRRATPIVRWRLTSADYPAISPDGSLIAYSTRRGIHIVDAAGGRARQVTTMGDEGAPSWAPDGRLVFVSRTFDPVPGANTIFRQSPIADAPDRAAVRTYEFRTNRFFSRSMDRISVAPNGRLVFLGYYGIVSMESDGSGVTLLMPFPHPRLHEYSAPSWSPAGDRIAFLELEHVQSQFFHTRLRIMNADGTNLETFVSVGAGNWLGEPSLCWSADGTQIAFTAPTGERSSHLFIARLRPLMGRGPFQVTTAQGVADGSVSCSR